MSFPQKSVDHERTRKVVISLTGSGINALSFLYYELNYFGRWIMSPKTVTDTGDSGDLTCWLQLTEQFCILWYEK